MRRLARSRCQKFLTLSGLMTEISDMGRSGIGGRTEAVLQPFATDTPVMTVNKRGNRT